MNGILLAEPKAFVYLRRWQTGQIIRCPLISNRTDFLMFGFQASKNLDCINDFWEPIPADTVFYVGLPPNRTLSRQLIEHYLQNYLNRIQYQTIGEVLNVMQKRTNHEEDYCSSAKAYQ